MARSAIVAQAMVVVGGGFRKVSYKVDSSRSSSNSSPENRIAISEEHRVHRNLDGYPPRVMLKLYCFFLSWLFFFRAKKGPQARRRSGWGARTRACLSVSMCVFAIVWYRFAALQQEGKGDFVRAFFHSQVFHRTAPLLRRDSPFEVDRWYPHFFPEYSSGAAVLCFSRLIERDGWSFFFEAFVSETCSVTCKPQCCRRHKGQTTPAGIAVYSSATPNPKTLAIWCHDDE